MSLEAGVLISQDEEVLYWHLPSDRSAGYLPDSRDLWDAIWCNRAQVLGFAHSHPGNGRPYPSMEDLTTFAAIESGLGRRLVWWITSEDSWIELRWCGPDRLDYADLGGGGYRPPWLEELRIKSEYRRNDND